MNAIPYDRPEEDWDSYAAGTEEPALPGRPRRQWWGKKTAAVFAVLLGAIGFYVGVRVEKSQMSSSSTGTGALAARLAAAGRSGATGTGGATARGGTTTGGATGRTGTAGGTGFRGLFGGGGGLGGAGATLGTVSSISGDTLYITETSGNTVKVTLSSATKVSKNVTVGKDAVRPGDTVVVAGAKDSNGTVSATTLNDTGAGLGGSGGGGSGGSGGSSNSGSSSSASSAVNSLFGGGGG
jgi:hypothetical protein